MSLTRRLHDAEQMRKMDVPRILRELDCDLRDDFDPVTEYIDGEVKSITREERDR